MDINLTKSQRESVEYNGGDLLVKGVAGSGKSIVLMQRALRFNKKAIEAGEQKQIVILTYANSLVKYTNEMIRSVSLRRNMIEVMTIDSLCRKVYLSMRHMRFVSILMKQDERKDLAEKALQNHLVKNQKHRFHDVDASFWIDEFKWIKEKYITTEDQYVNTERTGRGGKIRMTKDDKAVAYAIFTEYCTLVKKSNKVEWEDMYAYIIAHAAEIPEALKYDYILVDEAQDLSFVKLRVAKLLARRPITVAADKAQKIYNTSFSWRELGIDIRGKASKSLDKTFRSTKQIVQLAESLMEVNRSQQDDQSEYTDAVLPEREGPIPQIVSCKDAASEEQYVIGFVKAHATQAVTGILYHSFTEKKRITWWLKNAGIAYEDLNSKDSEWSLAKPGVKLCTLHSSKGLEFDAIIIPMFTENVFPLHLLIENADEDQIPEIKAQERSLLYVGMTRAKYDLCLTFSGSQSEYFYEFEPSFFKYVSNEGRMMPAPIRLVPSIQPTPSIQSVPSMSQVTISTAEHVVKNGSKLKVHIKGKDKKLNIAINTRSFPMQSAFIGKSVGDEVQFSGVTYVIDQIA